MSARSFREIQRECMAFRRGAAERHPSKTKKRPCRRPHRGTFNVTDDDDRYPCCGGKGVTKRALSTLFTDTDDGDPWRIAGFGSDMGRVDYDPCRALRDPRYTLSSSAVKATTVPGRSGVYRLDMGRGSRHKHAEATTFKVVNPRAPIASGSYGDVFEGMLLFATSTPRRIVLKVNRNNAEESDDEGDGDDEYFKEFYIHAFLFCVQRNMNVRGAKIPRILFMAETDTKRYIAMEHVKQQVNVYINQTKDDFQRWTRFASVLDQLCLMLGRFQSACEFMHGDMHSRNVMVDNYGAVFLIDFGMSSITDTKSHRVSVRASTRQFNPCLDLLIFLSSMLDEEIFTQQAVGLTMFGRKLGKRDYNGRAKNAGLKPTKSLIARFCHSVIEPFYEDVLENHDASPRPQSSNEERCKAEIAAYLTKKIVVGDYYKRYAPHLRFLRWRSHALYFGKAAHVNFKPTTPRRLLKRLRYLNPKIRKNIDENK